MRIDVEAPQTDNTDDGVDGGQVRKNRYLFRLSLLITAALLATAFWVSNTQTSAHAATEELALAVPTAPYCPPGSDKPSHSGDDGSPSGGSGPQSLNDRDLLAITEYTSSKFIRINNALRDGDPATIQRHSNDINALNSALRKLPDHRGTVYRTTEMWSEDLSSYKPNEIVTEKAFTSTTKDEEINYGRVRFVIESRTGKDITDYAEYREEKEVLFRPGARFLVEHKYQDRNEKWVIHMSEVP